jgi:hypothetical protein
MVGHALIHVDILRMVFLLFFIERERMIWLIKERQKACESQDKSKNTRDKFKQKGPC